MSQWGEKQVSLNPASGRIGKRQLLAIFQSLILVGSIVAMAGITVGAPGTPTSGPTAFSSAATSSHLDGPTTVPETSAARANTPSDTAEATADDPVYVDPSLRSANGTQVVVLRLTEADVSASMSQEEVISKLKTHAQSTQQSVRGFNQTHPAVDILQTFWVTNTVVLKIDTDKVSVENLTEIDHVRAVHDNFEVRKLSGAAHGGTAPVRSSATTASSQVSTTYGLSQINATRVWNKYGTRGGGVKVAVLDTGVDVSHPDIDLYTNNESDPTYPGGYAAFEADGDRIEGATPSDEDGHGTHVSGTVAGSNASGEYIGAAPNASLMHGKVIPGGTGTFAQVVAGIQWAVANDADVISMSLGFPDGYESRFIDPMQNARNAGVVVVVAAGNSGPGASGSPGDLYNVISVGASASDRTVAPFSSSEFIDTSSRFGADAPDSWPVNYTVPDVVAPGVGVKSSVPGGYAEFDGTSMATPHVAGAVALIESAASNNPSVDLVETALEATARPAAGLNQSNASQAIRDGAGIVDALAATDRVTKDQNVSARVSENLAGYAAPGENTTATFRVSNVQSVNVTLDGRSTAAKSDVSVWVNGRQINLSTSVSVSENATDDFTVTAQVSSRYERAVGLNVTFETSGATINSVTASVGPTRVHPDPMLAGDKAAVFNGKAPIENATRFATANTTIQLTNGTYDGFTISGNAAPGLTVEAAHPGEVTIQNQTTGAISLFPNRTTLADVEIDVNRSVVVAGNGSKLVNVTSHSRVIFTGVRGGAVVDSTIRNGSTGLVVASSENVRVARVTVTGESGIAVVGSADSVVEDSTARGTDGPGVAVVESDGVVVQNNVIRGSNVSAGFTGAVLAVSNGFGFGGVDTATSETDVVATRTVSVGGQTVTYGTFVPQAKGDYATTQARQRVRERRPAFLPNVTVAEFRNMTEAERRSLANQTRQRIHNRSLSNVSAAADANTTGGGSLSTADTASHDSDPARFVGNDIQGEAAGVVTAASYDVLSGNRITNISYPYYGVYATTSVTFLYSNTIDTDVGTNLSSESGVTAYLAYVEMYNNDITSRTAVRSVFFSGVEAYGNTLSGEVAVHSRSFSYVDSYQNTLRGNVAYKVEDYSFLFTGRDRLEADIGIQQRDSGYAFAYFTDFTIPTTAVDSEYDYYVDALVSWWGSDRGPNATQRANVDYYDPFLTAPPSEANLDYDELQRFGTDVTLESGEATAFAVPGPAKGNLSSMFPADFQGVVYRWDAQNQTWVQATGDEQLGALDAVVVVPTADTRVVMEFEESNSSLSTPPTKNVSQGWNLIGAPSYSGAETAFGASSASPGRIIDSFEHPDGQAPGDAYEFDVYTFGSGEYDPFVSAMTGYWVYMEEDGEVAANVPPGVTYEGFFERLDEDEGRFD